MKKLSKLNNKTRKKTRNLINKKPSKLDKKKRGKPIIYYFIRGEKLSKSS